MFRKVCFTLATLGSLQPTFAGKITIEVDLNDLPKSFSPIPKLDTNTHLPNWTKEWFGFREYSGHTKTPRDVAIYQSRVDFEKPHQMWNGYWGFFVKDEYKDKYSSASLISRIYEEDNTHIKCLDMIPQYDAENNKIFITGLEADSLETVMGFKLPKPDNLLDKEDKTSEFNIEEVKDSNIDETQSTFPIKLVIDTYSPPQHMIYWSQSYYPTFPPSTPRERHTFEICVDFSKLLKTPPVNGPINLKGKVLFFRNY